LKGGGGGTPLREHTDRASPSVLLEERALGITRGGVYKGKKDRGKPSTRKESWSFDQSERVWERNKGHEVGFIQNLQKSLSSG